MSRLVDVTVAVEERTATEVLLHTGIKEAAVWLPLSTVTLNPTAYGGVYVARMPERVAREKELI
jgi:hypothetical protein